MGKGTLWRATRSKHPKGAVIFTFTDVSGKQIPIYEGDAQSFEDKHVRIPFHECHEWVGAKSRNGYGAIVLPGRGVQVGAHRLSLALRLRRWPKGFVLHSCDNPGCVRPDHLREGTGADNARDRAERGRENPPRGDKHPHAVLSEAQVRAIREHFDPNALPVHVIAKLAGVNPEVIRDVVKGRSWRHVQ